MVYVPLRALFLVIDETLKLVTNIRLARERSDCLGRTRTFGLRALSPLSFKSLMDT